MKHLKLSILLAFFVVILSCDKNEDRQLSCCGFEISYEKEYTLESNWSLVGTIREKHWKEECTDGVGGTVTFDGSGALSGSSSCNQLGGNYQLTNSNGIEISNLYQTLRACIYGESEYWEEKFPKELAEASRFEIEGNKLIIYTSPGNQLVFIAYD